MNSEQAVRLISKVNKDTQDGSLSWHLESDEPSATYHNFCRGIRFWLICIALSETPASRSINAFGST
jgi:hypothetical protein